jgi:hypothetical protein
MSRTRLYVIGDKETGVIFITVNPLRAACISSVEIGDYAGNFNGTFSDMARAIKKLIVTLDGSTAAQDPDMISKAIGATIQSGGTVSDAEFCFVADLVNLDWSTARIPYPPLFDFLHHLAAGPDANPPQAYDGSLGPSPNQ